MKKTLLFPLMCLALILEEVSSRGSHYDPPDHDYSPPPVLQYFPATYNAEYKVYSKAYTGYNSHASNTL